MGGIMDDGMMGGSMFGGGMFGAAVIWSIVVVLLLAVTATAGVLIARASGAGHRSNRVPLPRSRPAISCEPATPTVG
ncbi:hypothetical protein ACX80O_06360 [Arthrobacter sp. Hz1]